MERELEQDISYFSFNKNNKSDVTFLLGTSFLSISPAGPNYSGDNLSTSAQHGRMESWRYTPSLASLLGDASPFSRLFLSHFLFENEAYILKLKNEEEFVSILSSVCLCFQAVTV